ncbi:MAG TPA: peptide deformylase [Solirubrobacteraceae bacterium]
MAEAEHESVEPQPQPQPERPEPEPEPELDPEVAARRAAALALVRQFGDPVLKTRALPVERFDDDLRAEVLRMEAIMGDSLGVGLAAPQLGVMHRLLVYRVGDAPLAALANPEIEWHSDEGETMEEGCLSLPGVHVDVDRSIHVVLRGADERGEALRIEASGLEARVIQHEIDHLDGVLILDRASRDQRKEAMRALRERAEAQRAAA